MTVSTAIVREMPLYEVELELAEGRRVEWFGGVTAVVLVDGDDAGFECC